MAPQSVESVFNDTATTEIYTLSLHDALPILRKFVPAVTVELGVPKLRVLVRLKKSARNCSRWFSPMRVFLRMPRSEEHTSELQSRQYLVCRLLLEKKIAPDAPLRHIARPAVL